MDKRHANLPDVVSSFSEENQQSSLSNDVWLRISAFLSTKSVNTRRTYAGIIKEWCRFLGVSSGTQLAANRLLSVTDLHASGFRAWLEERPGEVPRARRSHKLESSVEVLPVISKRKPLQNRDGLQETLGNATIAKKLSALRRIYKMLVGANIGISQNPFDSDKVPSPSPHAGRKRPTEMIDFELVQQVLDQPDAEKPQGRRDRAILAVLFGGGLRRGEIVKLRLYDVRKTPQGTYYLYLRSTKGRKDSDQAIPDWAASCLLEVLEDRQGQKAEQADYLFISYRGKGGLHPTALPISDSGVYKLFRFYCKKAGVPNFVTPHSARATAITKLLSDGISHREVQEFSRHASVQMVEVYDKRRMSVDENPGRKLEFGVSKKPKRDEP